MTTRERILRRMNLLPHPRHRATRRERCPQNYSQSQDAEGSQSPIGSPMLFHINPQIPPLTVGSAEVSFRSFNPSHHPPYPRSHRPRIQYRARHPKQCCTPRASCQEIPRDRGSTGSSGNDSCVQCSSSSISLSKSCIVSQSLQDRQTHSIPIPDSVLANRVPLLAVFGAVRSWPVIDQYSGV